jgi:chromosome segregation ATPase
MAATNFFTEDQYHDQGPEYNELNQRMNAFENGIHTKIVDTSLEIVKIALKEAMTKLTDQIETVSRGCHNRINQLEDMVEESVVDLRLDTAHSIVEATSEVSEKTTNDIQSIRQLIDQECDDNDATLSEAFDKMENRISELATTVNRLDKCIALLQREIQTHKTLWRDTLMSTIVTIFTGFALSVYFAAK